MLNMIIQESNMIRLSKIVLVSLITISGLFTTVAGAQKRYFGRKLDGHVINSLVTVSMESCSDECDKRKSCNSVNYHRLKKLCELNFRSVQDKIELKVAPGYVYSEELKTSTDECDGTCRPGMVCRNSKCEFAECRQFRVTNGFAYGNMNDIGSKLVTKCHDGYGIDRRLSTTQCEEQTGKWTVGNELICKKICSTPGNIDGGEWIKAEVQTTSGHHTYTADDITNILEDTVLEGSSLTYSCEDNLQLFGAPTIQCEAGKWSPSPVCFYQLCGRERFCSEPKLICSNNTCLCNDGLGNYTLKVCVETCPDILLITMKEISNAYETLGSDTTDGPISEEQFTSVAPEECKGICLRAPKFACKGFYEDLSINVFDNTTCVLWSVYLVDWTDGSVGLDRHFCMHRL